MTGALGEKHTVSVFHPPSAPPPDPSLKMFQRDPRAGAFFGGDRVSGQDVRDQNGASAT